MRADQKREARIRRHRRVRGKVSGYSIDRLFRFLNALGQRIEIAIRPDNGKNRNNGIAVRS